MNPFEPIPLAPLAPRLFVGPAPLAPEDFARLVELGVSRLLSLQTDADLARFGLRWANLWQLLVARQIQPVRVPIVDVDRSDFVRRLPEAVAALESLSPDLEGTYVHCTAGINRSPSVVLAVLARLHSFEEADLALTQAHPAALPYRDAVMRFLASSTR